ncbi:hypothetical protein [Mucilaginibacter sp.]
MNSDERKERIRYLRLQEERKRKLPGLLALASRLSANDIDESCVISIEQGQALQAQLDRSLYQAAFIVSFPLTQLSKLQSILTQSNLLNQENYLTAYDYQDIAMLKIDTSWITEHLLALLDFDGNTIYTYDLAFGNMMWIDHNEGNWYEDGTSTRTWIYELRVYGKAWIDSAYTAYKDLAASNV